MFVKCFGSLMIASFAMIILSSTGCSQKGKEESKAKEEKKGDGKKEITKAETKHEGWWCQEHGVPEDLCSLCSNEVASQCKKEGDWCKIHGRAQSQCFKCDPGKYAKFEAMYVAKYNKKPERPPEEEFKK